MQEFRENLSREDRIHLVKVVFCLIAVFGLIGMWTATQRVAADCAYNELLGDSMSVGPYQVYLPFMFFWWQSEFEQVMPAILHAEELWLYGISAIGVVFSAVYIRNSRRLITHGSAE